VTEYKGSGYVSSTLRTARRKVVTFWRPQGNRRRCRRGVWLESSVADFFLTPVRGLRGSRGRVVPTVIRYGLVKVGDGVVELGVVY
jgi:hypothetical protein